MKYADLILLSTAIFDSVGDTPFSGGVAVCGDRIEFVGSREAALQYRGTMTEVRDFGDRLIMPGFCDGHAHLEGASNTFCAPKVSLHGGKSEAECVERTVRFAKEHPELKRITGMGWTLNDFGPGAPEPTKKELDRLFPNTPVYLQAADGHTSWVNSAAIKECRLEEYLAENPETPAFWAPRDEAGELTGFLREGPSAYAYFFSIKNPPELYAKYFRELLDMCASYGITGFTDLTMTGADDLAEFFAPIKALENAGKLHVRIHAWPGVAPADMADMKATKRIAPYIDLYNTDKMHLCGLKTLIDGTSEALTAAMLEPYASDPTQSGEPMIDVEDFNRWVTEANRLGFSVKIHCIGDRAVRLALDGFAASKAAGAVTENTRNGVEHWENLHDDDVKRFAELGAVASFQPAHVVLGKGFAEQNLGMERFKREFRWRDVAETGAHLSVGTDAPVVQLDPFITVYNAVTRLDTDGTQYSPYTEDQKLPLPTVLKAYTAGANYAAGFEHKAGTLEAGKYADIVVWDRDPFAVDPMELKDCRAVCTVFDGKIVYEARQGGEA